MHNKKFIVITSINYPTEGIKKIAKFSKNWKIIIVGDKKTPNGWNCEGVQFLSFEDQLNLASALVKECPANHYARKNIGYLKAIQSSAEIIAETDDDNIPYGSFLAEINKHVVGQPVQKQGWENIYTHFVDTKIWPRGFPLEYVNESLKNPSPLGEVSSFDCPIQQYLADGDPDVDAVYRLTTETETKFKPNTVILGNGTFCPFNSQNTLWWPEAYPLLYLPSFVSFRMTDIWRSFIAQICLYKLGKHLAFREATVFQLRNEHSLIRDFKDEVPGYLDNVRIIQILSDLPLSNLPEQTGENLRLCYEKLVEAGIIPQKELYLVNLWLEDLTSFCLK
ncbi:MAG: STELLO glycosyltransferase family protein [Nostoc sp. CreGUA01]|nr:STELLO glycosyltransferase family protein [Nostoc sp. CreGUA01]